MNRAEVGISRTTYIPLHGCPSTLILHVWKPPDYIDWYGCRPPLGGSPKEEEPVSDVGFGLQGLGPRPGGRG